MLQDSWRIAMIGAGRLGQSWAYLLRQTPGMVLGSVYCQTAERADAAVQLIGGGHACHRFIDLQPADLVWLTVPDDHIASVCYELASMGYFTPETMVVHSSGALTTDVLSTARDCGASVGVVHPILSLSEPERSIGVWDNVWVGLEGDEDIYVALFPFFKRWGIRERVIAPEDKTLYHAACVITSNHVLSLCALGQSLLGRCGFSTTDSMSAISRLVRSVLQAWDHAEGDACAALTGPIQRGDIQTVQKHLKVLQGDPEQYEVYQALSRLCLQLTTHPLEKKQLFTTMLSSETYNCQAEELPISTD